MKNCIHDDVSRKGNTTTTTTTTIKSKSHSSPSSVTPISQYVNAPSSTSISTSTDMRKPKFGIHFKIKKQRMDPMRRHRQRQLERQRTCLMHICDTTDTVVASAGVGDDYDEGVDYGNSVKFWSSSTESPSDYLQFYMSKLINGKKCITNSKSEEEIKKGKGKRKLSETIRLWYERNYASRLQLVTECTSQNSIANLEVPLFQIATPILDRMPSSEAQPTLVLLLWASGFSIAAAWLEPEGMASLPLLPYISGRHRLLEFVDRCELPPELVDILPEMSHCCWYEGSIIIEVRDLRSLRDDTRRGIAVATRAIVAASRGSRRICLRPSPISRLGIVYCIMNSKRSWEQAFNNSPAEEWIETEHQLIDAMRPNVVLNPHVSVLFAQNAAARDACPPGVAALSPPDLLSPSGIFTSPWKLNSVDVPAELPQLDNVTFLSGEGHHPSISIRTRRRMVAPASVMSTQYGSSSSFIGFSTVNRTEKALFDPASASTVFNDSKLTSEAVSMLADSDPLMSIQTHAASQKRMLPGSILSRMVFSISSTITETERNFGGTGTIEAENMSEINNPELGKGFEVEIRLCDNGIEYESIITRPSGDTGVSRAMSHVIANAVLMAAATTLAGVDDSIEDVSTATTVQQNILKQERCNLLWLRFPVGDREAAQLYAAQLKRLLTLEGHSVIHDIDYCSDSFRDTSTLRKQHQQERDTASSGNGEMPSTKLSVTPSPPSVLSVSALNTPLSSDYLNADSSLSSLDLDFSTARDPIQATSNGSASLLMW